MINQQFKHEVKIISIARRLALEYDYCPEFQDCKDCYDDYLYFEATKEEVEDACKKWSGNREDEISNALDKLF
jgi:hypothetical protein